MSRRARIKVNERAVESLKAIPEVGDHLRDLAESVLDRARSTAPVKSGAYRASLRVEDDVVDDAQVARVVADVPYAIYVEADTGTLARALDAAAQ